MDKLAYIGSGNVIAQHEEELDIFKSLIFRDLDNFYPNRLRKIMVGSAHR